MTYALDEGEKLLAYMAIPSLCVYAMVERTRQQIVVLRRTVAGFVREVHAGVEAVVALPEIGTELALAEVYDGVKVERS